MRTVPRHEIDRTCFAKEMGVAIDVESPYIPTQLVQGAWVGEFTT